MCGFMFSSDTKIDKRKFEKEFAKIAYRGPDMSRIEYKEQGIFGFHRLAVMGLSELGMQPFHRNGYTVICNGELYGFRNVKQILQKRGYDFVCESDCEILIPLYMEYGVNMFNMLNAEFACVLYDKKGDTVVAARDPFGIRPMFYGYTKENNKIMFASEIKCLTELCSQVFPFPPGHYFYKGVFTCYKDVS